MQKSMITLALLWCSTHVFADVPKTQMAEVQHLIKFVKNSECTINRNGSNHKGPKAAGHILKKYNHFRDDIEDFIRLSATKSTMSGKYYQVACPGKAQMKTQDWLLAELKRYRKH